jgi:hypothetical protein
VKTPSVSAGGAKEYSPERSAAELRDSIPSPWNPFQGVTEMASHQIRRCPCYGGPFRRPFSGALPLWMMNPEFRCASLRALVPPRPMGALPAPLFHSSRE